MVKINLTDAQRSALKDIAAGLSRGESAPACRALERRGLIHGDWLTGYYLTQRGQGALAQCEARG